MTQRALCAVFLTKMHIKCACGTLDRLDVATAGAVVAGRARNSSMVAIGAVIASWTLADSISHQRALVANHADTALRR